MITVTEAASFNSRWEGSGFSLGRLNEDIFCLRFELTIEEGGGYSEFSFYIGDGRDEAPSLIGDGYSTDSFKILRENGFFGTITTNKEEYLLSTNKGYLDAEKIINETNRFQISVEAGSNSKYKVTGTVPYNLLGGQVYYLWLYAIRINGGFGRLGNYLTTLNIVSESLKSLGLAKIYVPKSSGSKEYEYKDALVYIYTNGTWQLALPYVYTGDTWKNTC